MKRPCLWLAVWGCLVGQLAFAGNAHDVFGAGPRGAAMAGAMVAEADDHTAAFYNPALLGRATKANFGLGFAWYRLGGTVDPDTAGNKSLDCEYCSSPDTVLFQAGFVLPIGGKINNRLALGVSASLPASRLVRVLAPEPGQPFWLMYNSAPERLLLHAGLSVKIVDWLSLGIGLQAFADLVGAGASVEVDLFSKQVTSRSVDSSLATRGSPLFSLLVSPLKNLRFGMTFRWERFLLYSIPAAVDLKGVGTLGFTVEGITHYTPHTLEFGASWAPIEPLTIAASASWQNWSAAPSPYLDLSIDLSGDTLKALGLDEALDVKSPAQPPGFVDTLNFRLGIEYRVNERFAARGGFFFRPTPVPQQNTAGTNILDASTLGITGGIGFNFSDPLEVFSQPLTIDLAGQAQFLLPREAKKDATDDQPSYRYDGKAYGLNIAVRYDF